MGKINSSKEEADTGAGSNDVWSPDIRSICIGGSIVLVIGLAVLIVWCCCCKQTSIPTTYCWTISPRNVNSLEPDTVTKDTSGDKRIAKLEADHDATKKELANFKKNFLGFPKKKKKKYQNLHHHKHPKTK